MKRSAFICLFLIPASLYSQTPAAQLTVERIMRDPKWIGSSPSSPFWSNDGKKLYFLWNPDKSPADSLYYITLSDNKPVKVSVKEKQEVNETSTYNYNQARTACVYSRNGDLFYADKKAGNTRQITSTTDTESNPQFSFNDSKIVYQRGQNLYAWDIAGGETLQLTNIRSGDAGTGGNNVLRSAGVTGVPKAADNKQEQWLLNDNLAWFQVLRERKEKREKGEAYTKSVPKDKELRSIALDDKSIQGLAISPDGRYISYRLTRFTGSKPTFVPSYVTETGFTIDLNSRTKVGSLQANSEMFIYDREADTVYSIRPDSIEGIRDFPDYLKDYPKQLEEKSRKNTNRAVSFGNLSWSPKGTNAVLEIRSQDNKDRWLYWFEKQNGRIRLLDRQRDEAWIGGPGAGGFGNSSTGWLDESNFWFRSEASGYSHIYVANHESGGKKAITSGNYEIQQADLSEDRKYFYIISNEVHPGEQHFYRLRIADGKKERITFATGASQVTVSPDEKTLAILYSAPTRPWELFVQENKTGSKPTQVTFQARSEEFNAYPWREPEVISFTARDGAQVYARLYKPVNPHPNKPAVLFVHGAGYLQNAHKWWSSYFREYMFNNLLADNGYYVMDIDYRGSAGYGRDWRTGIYRHMGGKDLTDHTDAVDFLVKQYGVNPHHVGLYGGSYGGFITLMGMFTQPDVFAAGAALRPVTDWANYNHGYTSNILNEPFTDSLAYRKSSPLYFAEGLKGNLLICHGMIDLNVHYQDAVKLTQRLIELGKNNWELASYPMEDHGFVEPSSWTDEYKRIYRLFETVLKK